MSREILFKAKRIDNGEWVRGFYYESHISGDYILQCKTKVNTRDGFIVGDVVVPIEIDYATLCQYTGLTDKNGVKIYENDIVDGHAKRGAAFNTCEVLWNEGRARFDVRAMGCSFPMTTDKCAGCISMSGLDYEVIGNIFDNPEFLEGDRDDIE